MNRARSSAKLTRISATKPAILSRPGPRIVLGHAVAFDAFLQRDSTAVLEGADELAAHCAERARAYAPPVSFAKERLAAKKHAFQRHV